MSKLGFSTDSREILRDVSFSVDDGEFVVITGPNGSGKSTLLKVLMGIIPVSSGQILVDGDDITEASVTERAGLGLSYAFQTPVRFKGVKVQDLLQIAATGENTLYKASEFDCGPLISAVGLSSDYLKREVSDSLSGGELKRIEIASVLARDGSVLMFDEPEAGIDMWSFDNLLEVFKGLRGRKTLIIVSHQKKLIEQADKVIVLKGGKIAKIGPTKEILPTLKESK